MAVVIFTAKRSLLPETSEDDVVSMGFRMRDAVRSRNVRKTVHRSSGGGMTTVNLGADTRWELEFGPIPADDKDAAEEFFESTAGGELFQFSPFGTVEVSESEGVFLQLRRVDGGHRFVKMIRTPELDRERYTVRISAVEN